jgi:hypothetical protein
MSTVGGGAAGGCVWADTETAASPAANTNAIIFMSRSSFIDVLERSAFGAGKVVTSRPLH